MARSPSPSDFDAEVEGIGSFTFGRRNFQDEIKVQVSYARIIEGVSPTPWLHAVASWMSDLRVLTVRAPEGWDLDSIDPLDDDCYSRLFKVHAALAAKEESFRAAKRKASEKSGT